MNGEAPIAFRVGTVALVGRPNVGKSTLMNAIVGFGLSIVSRRPQTTRHRILGIAHREGGQILFVDTPGMHGAAGRAMNRYMNRAAAGALTGVDLACLVCEAGVWKQDDERALRAVKDAGVPCVAVLNKVDKVKDKASLLPWLKAFAERHDFAALVPVSAEKGVGLEDLSRTLLDHLPEGEPQYSEDDITDRSERFLVAEMIREQLMRQLGEELPYASTVEIEQYREEGRLLRVSAVIWVEREGQKGIVVGAGGQQMRAIGQSARMAIERLLDRKVHLELWCKVRENWSDDEAQLRRFGYVD